MPADSSQLRSTIIAIAVPVTVVVFGLGAFLADRIITSQLEQTALFRLGSVSRRASSVIMGYLADNRANLVTLSRGPALIAAAQDAASDADRTGLATLSIDQLEARFDATRALRNTPIVQRYLESFQEGSDLVEIFFTERHGFNVAWSNRTSDFAQADEAWWQDAMRDGSAIGDPELDESAGIVAIEISVRMDDPATGRPIGVVKGVLQLTRLAHLVAGTDDANDATVEVIDSTGRIILARDAARILTAPEEARAIPRERSAVVRRMDLPGRGDRLVATTPTNEGRWWVVAQQPVSSAFQVARAIREIVLGAAGTGLVLLVLLGWIVMNWLTQRVITPIRTAALVTAQVAEGDLTVHVDRAQVGSGEAESLLQSVETMVSELRSLVEAIRGSSEELAAMGQQISASTEEMTASTDEMASTSQRLSDQSNQQAEQVRKAAGDAQQILAITSSLADGAKLASDRSEHLRATADQHRVRLEDGSRQLAQLAEEVQQGTQDAESLAALSHEVQQFVTQAKAIANRTNMLALNAAIEAARAGGEGRGFAIVADEVRKLATQAAKAAVSTSETVDRVSEGIQHTSGRLLRLAKDSASVRDIAESAAGGLRDVTEQASEGSAWAQEIAEAAGKARHLVGEITQRLAVIAEATETFVAAIEQIAASSEEQSASTQEIANSAAELAVASAKLNDAVSRFRVSRNAD
ncbi:MAG TPA: methyl-accepting chemotaxis protein [Gemmatimonadales bacterium]